MVHQINAQELKRMLHDGGELALLDGEKMVSLVRGIFL